LRARVVINIQRIEEGVFHTERVGSFLFQNTDSAFATYVIQL